MQNLACSCSFCFGFCFWEKKVFGSAGEPTILELSYFYVAFRVYTCAAVLFLVCVGFGNSVVLSLAWLGRKFSPELVRRRCVGF